MARPREFDEGEVLDAALACFWSRGYESTSMRDLIDRTGLTGASLYNAFGDKRSLFEKTLAHYIDGSIADRIRRCEAMPPRKAIAGFLDEIVRRSLADPERKGCLLVNSAVDLAAHDAAFGRVIAAVLVRIETFFRRAVERGQAEATITRAVPAADLARHLLATLMGIRVLARARPERALLEGIARSALLLLDDRRDVAG